MARTFVAASNQLAENYSWSNIGLPITQACWFRTTDPSLATQTIATLASAGNPSMGLAVDQASQKAEGYIVDNGGNLFSVLGAIPSANTWVGLVYVENGTSRTLYQDAGTFTDSTSATAGTMGRLAIGAYPTSPGAGVGFLNGRAAEYAIWSVALTAGEAKAYISGVRAKDIRPASLKGYWPVDGIESPEPDYSGSKFNLTLTNTPAAAAGPPMTLFTPRRPMFIPGAAVTFIPAWAQGSNLPVLGTGHF